MNLKCPTCNAELEETDDDWNVTNAFNLREQPYGCDTGCMTVFLEVDCECGYTGTAWCFGEFYDGTHEEREEYLTELYDELE